MKKWHGLVALGVLIVIHGLITNAAVWTVQSLIGFLFIGVGCIIRPHNNRDEA